MFKATFSIFKVGIWFVYPSFSFSAFTCRIFRCNLWFSVCFFCCFATTMCCG